MPEGGDLVVRTSCVDGSVQLQVSDSGRGIPEHMQGKVFDPFFTTKAAGEGSGLGLSIVYGFVKQTGGDIDLSSAPGQGTTVRLSFARAAAPLARSPGRESRTPPLPALQGLAVLVVDDNESFRATVADMLARVGAIPVAAATAEEALALLEAGPLPALVLSDICLGAGLDGLRFKRVVEERWPGMPVALMSGLSPEMLQDRQAWDGGAPFLQKPFELQALQQWLASLLPVEVS
jgi:CheY-like chemotaxis protein